MKGLCPLSKNNNICYNKKIAIAVAVGVAAAAALYLYFQRRNDGPGDQAAIPAAAPQTPTKRARTSARSRRDSRRRPPTKSPHAPKARSPTEKTQRE